MEKGKDIAVVCLALLLVMAAVIAAVGGLSALAERLDSERLKAELPEGEVSRAGAPEDALPALSSAKVGWGIGPARNALGQPEDALTADAKYAALGAHFLLPEAGDTVFLTFDCGYENGYTAPILDVLREKGVQAVFFLTGDYLDEAPELITRMVQEGHVIGNHTGKHPSLPAVSAERAKRELTELHARIQQGWDYEMQLFRFPMGEYSEQTLSLVQSLGYESIFWSFAYRDWLPDEQPDTASALRKLTGALHPGAIYLLHAVSSANAAILGDFIDSARAAGYTFGRMLPALGREAPSPQPESLIGSAAVR